MKEKVISKETLYDLFITQKMSHAQIAEYLHIGKTTVVRKLKKYGITQPDSLKWEKRALSQTIDLGVSKEELEQYYIKENMSRADLSKKYNVSQAYMARQLKKFGIKKPKELELQNRDKTMLAKYGVKYSMQSKEIQDKAKQTNLEKYGVENVSSLQEIKDKRIETIRDKYGVDNVFQSDEIKNAIKEHNKSVYGVEYTASLEDIKEKIRQTNLEKYGVEWFCEHQKAIEANKPYKISSINKKFAKKLEDNNIIYEMEYSIDTKSYDFKVDNTLIEIDPSYTHNVTLDTLFRDNRKNIKDKNKQLNKTLLANENGFNCIHIFDWDDEDKIINMLKPKAKLYARQCEIKEVPVIECVNFLNNYHLQGACHGQTIRLGLYYKDNLVEIMTFGKPRYNRNYQYELLRLCTHKDYMVTGGAEKLFKYFIENYNPRTVISYCDKSKFSGDVYTRLGFTLHRNNKPSKHWYNEKLKYHITDNFLRQRGFDQIFGTDFGKGTSNEELMILSGFLEVYDCGQSTYTLNI